MTANSFSFASSDGTSPQSPLHMAVQIFAGIDAVPLKVFKHGWRGHDLAEREARGQKCGAIKFRLHGYGSKKWIDRDICNNENAIGNRKSQVSCPTWLLIQRLIAVAMASQHGTVCAVFSSYQSLLERSSTV